MEFFKATNEENAYVKAAAKYANNVVGKDVAKLFELAQAFDKDVKLPENLKKALPWAKKAHEGYPKYEHSLLYANLLLKTGDKKTAHNVAEQALEIGKKQGTFVGQAQQIFDTTKP